MTKRPIGLFLLAASLATSSIVEARSTLRLTDSWRFARGNQPGAERPAFDDAAWDLVSVPHDWAIAGPFDPDGDNETGKLPWRGVGWYRRPLDLSAEDRGMMVVLVFDGRSASLGAGATPWQTAVRIGVPTAMSGLFSAVMVGLGRAVGETMIVLMAAGNTPILEWNVFEGFRTLSANIAVELPEAVQGSTHYRTLFLAALVLFAMTFVVKTVAEVVRQRFRKRAYQL